MESEKLSNKGWKLLIQLIEAGEGMTDAAETCGHEEALEDWNKTVLKVEKLFGVTPEGIKETRRMIEKAKEAKYKGKEEAFEKKRKKEAEDLKKELGY